MSPRLDRAELSQREKNQAADLMLQIAVLLQGGVLSAAAFSVIGIFQTQDDTWIRLMLWLTSVIIGLLMSVALMGAAASYIAKLLERYRWIAYIGLAIVVYVAVMMIYHGWEEVAKAMG